MKKAFVLALALLMVVACKPKDRKTYLPNVSGKAGEVVVVLNKAGWDGNLGQTVRETLGADCPFLPVREPLYTLINVSPSNFESSTMFKVHRNLLLFNINPDTQKEGVEYLQDGWANPQCVIRVNGKTLQEALDAFCGEKTKILSALEMAERDRVIRNTKKYEQRDIFHKVAEVFGGSPHFPAGYVLRKITDDFAWVQYEMKGSNILGILIYKYPAESGADEFTLENIIERRNEIMKENVPGMLDGSYMTTAGPEDFPAYVEYIKYKGRDFAQTRGMWEVEGDFMGGPFVSESFYSKDGKEVVVTEGFVYRPSKDKRLYLRQVESVLYSWDWVEK